MLKLHSFLQRIKKPICKVIPNNIGKYKTHMAVVVYAMATVLFILSPDYIYGARNNNVEVYAKAETKRLALEEIEETAKEAIILTNQNYFDSKFILCDLTTDGSPIKYGNQLTLKWITEGKPNKSTVLSDSDLESNTDKDTTEENQSVGSKTEDTSSEADSKQVGAVAIKTVDSSSTNEKKKKDTEETKQQTTKKTTQKTAETEQETEKKETKNTEQTVIKLSKEDTKVLQRIVEAEATGEDIKGKILVANVILNRVNDEGFPDTIKEVVFQKDGSTYQFSPIKDNRYWSVEITKDTITAVKRVLEGEDYSKGALYFSARSKADRSSMKWFDNNLEFLFQYGGHEFFKEK